MLTLGCIESKYVEGNTGKFKDEYWYMYGNTKDVDENNSEFRDILDTVYVDDWTFKAINNFLKKNDVK